MPLYPTTDRLSLAAGGGGRSGGGPPINDNISPLPFETTWNDFNTPNNVRPVDGSNRSPTLAYNIQRGVPQNQPFNPNQYYANTKYYNSHSLAEAMVDRSVTEYNQYGDGYTRLPMKSVDFSNQVRQPVMQPIYHDFGQNPPYTIYKGRVFEPLSYEDNLIRDRYPKKFAIAHSAIMIILCLTAVVLQIIMIIYQSPYYFIGGGIWSGLYFILCAILALVLSRIKYIQVFVQP